MTLIKFALMIVISAPAMLPPLQVAFASEGGAAIHSPAAEAAATYSGDAWVGGVDLTGGGRSEHQALGVDVPAVAFAGGPATFATFAQANTTPVRITCRDASLFRQYSPRHGPSERLHVLTAGERVGWRHNYNGDWAVVLYYRTAQWGFVMRRCLG